MRQNNILYIRKADDSDAVKTGICGDIITRLQKVQTETAEPVEYCKLYAITNMPKGWNLKKVEDKFADYFSDDKYRYISKKQFKIGRPRPTEMYNNIVVDESDEFFEYLKGKKGLEYVVFNDDDLEGLVKYLESNPQTEIDQYESNVNDSDYEDDDSISESSSYEINEDDVESDEDDVESDEEYKKPKKQNIVIDLTNSDDEQYNKKCIVI